MTQPHPSQSDPGPTEAARPAIAVIPARFDSSRFPGKPLADRTGKPMILHVIERARQAKRVSRVLVATDDQRIYDATRSFGAEVVMTRSDHTNGTSRIAEAVANLYPDAQPNPDPKRDASDLPIVVNVQGDEPEVDPGLIDTLIDALLSDLNHPVAPAPMATLASPFMPGEDPDDPNLVKVVTTQAPDRRALYFSRSRVPFFRDEQAGSANSQPVELLKHPGLYAYWPGFLQHYVKLAATPLEQAERLEQLRALEHGYPIAVAVTEVRHHGIDTPEQYDRFVERYAESCGRQRA